MNRIPLMLRAMCAALLATAVVPAAHAADPDPAAPENTKKLDERLKKYWGSEVRDIVTLQKRKYRKEDRVEFELVSGVVPNDEFTTYFPVGGRVDYFFAEDFGAEVWGSYQIRVASELESFLEANFNQSLLVELPQKLQWMAGADFLWSPFHGKLGFFAESLAHFDMHFAFGVGIIGTTVEKLGETKSKPDIAGNVGLGMRVFLNDMIALRFDYRQFFYGAEGGGLSHPAELTLGVSFFTSAPE